MAKLIPQSKNEFINPPKQNQFNNILRENEMQHGKVYTGKTRQV